MSFCSGSSCDLSILSPISFSVFSYWNASCSASFRVSTRSLRFLSSSAWISASCCIFLTSSSLSFCEDVMRMLCSFLVARSFAATCTMPLASMSNMTSICGTPLGAGGMPSRLKLPRSLLSLNMGRSPCDTRMVTAVWLSDAVEKTWLFFVGMVVLRSMSFVKTPPRVSMPRLNGVTSSSRMSLTSPASTPACMAAPWATHSIGSTPLSAGLPT
ncbi:MAG: hypothetical protein QT04_C0004G0012 [archaeon GW2011_AR11]|nr:MAG: hypothetical protein QT04_C0004G0012 [archaeon GW2011_AR11]